MHVDDVPSEPPWAAARAKRDRQIERRRHHRVVSVGMGPDPVVNAWPIGPDSWVRCVVCGYLILLDGDTTDTCWCGAMHSDAGAARIGSDLGDDAIERVRLERI
jgi:hypothetical protein